MEKGALTSPATVQTVLGPLPVTALGVTLMHEHILTDVRSWWHPSAENSKRALAERPVEMSILSDLRHDPFLNRDNCHLSDVAAAVEELWDFRELGGQTVVDPTVRGIGRDPVALRAIAQRTGLHIISGTGYYLEASHPPEIAGASVETIAAHLLEDIESGDPVLGIRAGLIGEIGVSARFTPAERTSLRAAAQVQRHTHLPLMIHLPGWERLAHEVLNVVEAEGGELRRVILCHMNPSGDDVAYQQALLRRGCYLEYDMIGMDFFYADQQAQSPCDEENARAIAGLLHAGFGPQLLLSQDVFVKIQLRRYGGNGYGHILRNFVPRLMRHGITRAEAMSLLIDNPRTVFTWPEAAC